MDNQPIGSPAQGRGGHGRPLPIALASTFALALALLLGVPVPALADEVALGVTDSATAPELAHEDAGDVSVPAVRVLADKAESGTADEDAAEPGDAGEDTTDSDDAEQGDPEPPVIAAQLLDGERRIHLTASGDALADATELRFDVWSDAGGRANAVRHGALRLADGTWTATAFVASAQPEGEGVPYNCRIDGAVHRLYNPNTGQHFYTADTNEADTISRGGWTYEGVAWLDAAGAEGAQPVWRLYNPFSGDHFYTMDAGEYASLGAEGWVQENVAFHSDPASAQIVRRLYNPYAEVGSHHFTTSLDEYYALKAQGWIQEGKCWYGAAMNADASWSLPDGNRPHGDFGGYHVEAVATLPDGEAADEGSEEVPTVETVVGEATFAVTRPTAQVEIANVDDHAGTFDVIVRDVQSVSGVSWVGVPVWSAVDQGDLVWYMAEPQGDGTYKVSVRAADHGYAHDYQVHAYVHAGNGLHVNEAQLTCSVSLANLIHMSGGPNTYTVTIENPGPAGRVQMPTWSEAGGQDDIVWYDAVEQGGRWVATITTDNLRDSGHCITQVHVDGEVRGAIDFDVSPREVLTNRQRAIIAATRRVPTLGNGFCAGWVSTVLMRAGQPYNLMDDANDMYYRLHETDLSQILPGMIIACATHGHTYNGSIWGHVGIYLGDGIVIDDVGYIRTTTLDWWATWYSDRVPVRIGFLEY